MHRDFLSATIAFVHKAMGFAANIAAPLRQYYIHFDCNWWGERPREPELT
jgi:hypothetical protein